MKPTREYLALESSSPLRGLATTPPSNRLDPSYSPKLLNVIVRDGVVRRRSGYLPLGRRLIGKVLLLTEFGKIGEDGYFVVLTTHRQYAYDPTSQDFVDLTPDQINHTIIDTTANVFTINGNHASEFPVSRLIPVVGGPNEGVYEVISASNVGLTTEITVKPDPPISVSGGDIVLARDFTTPQNNVIVAVPLTDGSGHRLLVTNGSDTPRTWDGDLGHSFQDWAPTFPEFITCKTLAVFYDHLVLGGLVLTTGEEPSTIAWSDSGDFDRFTGGNSGTQLLHSMTGGIKALRLLGDRLAVYSNDAIITATFVGSPAIFGFDVVIPQGARLVSPNAIVSINVGHIYAAEENFYLFDGTRGLRVLSETIYTDYKESKDHSRLYLCSALNDYAKKTLYFAFPAKEGGYVVYTAEYDVFDLRNIVWSKERYSHNPTAFGFYTNRTEELMWDDATWEPTDMPWEQELGAWGEEAEQLNFPIRAFGTDEGYVFLCTEGILYDWTEPAEQVYETMDFTSPETFLSVFGRWTEVELELAGSRVRIDYSTDLGQNFNELAVLDLSSSFTPYQLPFDVTSRTLRFRLFSREDFALRWLRVWTRPGAPR